MIPGDGSKMLEHVGTISDRYGYGSLIFHGFISKIYQTSYKYTPFFLMMNIMEYPFFSIYQLFFQARPQNGN
jgi:hypothetical protein